MNELHLVQYAERMWLLCGAREILEGVIVPLVYKGRAIAWFTRKDLGQAFIRGISSLAALQPCLVEVQGAAALHHQAVELRRRGVIEIYVDLSPHRQQQADGLDGFIRELEGRMKGEGSPIVN